MAEKARVIEVIKTWKSGSVYASWYRVGPEKGMNVKVEYPCHSQFISTTEDTLIASIFAPPYKTKEDKELAEAFWEWVSSHESPWRKIFEPGDIELIRLSDGTPKGWVITEKTIKTVPPNFIKNFAILTRVVSEKQANWKLWKTLIDKGVSGHEALYLASMFKINPQNQIGSALEFGGGHWPLTIGHDYNGTKCYFSWKTFSSGEINTEKVSPKINGFFCRPGEKEIIFNYSSILKETFVKQTGAFSTASILTIDLLINEFNKWKKVNKVTDGKEESIPAKARRGVRVSVQEVIPGT